MPWDVIRRGEYWVVVGKDGEVKGRHKTRAEALRQQRALYANVPESRKSESDGKGG